MTSISRRGFLGGSLGWAALVLASCGQSAAPASLAAAKPSVTASAAASPQSGASAAAAGSATGSAAASGSYAPPADWQQKWNALLDAAKKEGTLTVHFAAGGGPPARTALPSVFKQAFGIDLQILVQPTAEFVTRLKLEQSAGQFTVDAVVSGANTMYSDIYGAKMFQPLKPKIIHPDAANPANWTTGKMWFRDPEEQYILQIANAVTGWVVINTTMIKPGELTSWQDLLKPQYKGKIASFDPTINGQGGQQGVYLDLKLGTDYVKKLYQGQNVQLTRDNGQFADWLGRGNYAIAVSMDGSSLEGLKKDGLPVDVVQPPFSDGPGYVTGNTGLVGLLTNPPHPNAAQLFCNWMATADGQNVYDKAIRYVSPLKTVKSDWMPDYDLPKPGVDYLDTYSWEYAQTTYPAHFDAMRKALGAS